jgi:tetratricopeptide (TPR) repeat protein/serine/threonine protein kinase
VNERDLFIAAVQIDDSGRRSDYLDRECAGDRELRQRVDALLDAFERAGSFLRAPGSDVTVDLPAGPPDPAPETVGTFVGPYKLLQPLGEGGMGAVWLAEQTEPVRRQVAVKVIRAGMDTKQVIARFEAERQALALMDHPNIARVFDGGTTAGGRPYFVMELVKGVPITRYCDEHHLNPRERLELFVPVCQAVQHAHQKGIIHRDLKPSNVLVCLYDGRPVPKVIDFGVAKAAGPRLTDKTLFTEIGAVVGTLEYMSPEQAELNQLDVDTRSDVYSLGVLLYELLTGTTPLQRGRLREAAFLEILRVIREEEPPRPSTRLSDSGPALASISAQRRMEPARLTKLIRGELDWVVMKALEKDRNRRYESPLGLAHDVEHYLNDEAVAACPPSAWYRVRKLARRNRRSLTVASLVLFSIVLVVVGAGWVVRDRARREETVLNDRRARDHALDDEVERILDEADGLIAAAKWPDALAAVDRSEKLLRAAGRPTVPPRVTGLRRDLTLAERVENIYFKPKTEEFFLGPEPDAAYAQVFAEEGIDPAALSADEAATLIRGRSVWRELARALDLWSFMRQRAGGKARPDWKELTEIAEAVDSDPWRNRLRRARRSGDQRALVDLLSSADATRLSPDTAVLLTNSLYESGRRQAAKDFLRRACVQNPDDWWLNNMLGWYCLTATPPEYDDALRYYTASAACRPRNAHTQKAIGQVLQGKHAFADAIAAFSRAIELDPDLWEAWFYRGRCQLKMGHRDLALADFNHVIERLPNDAVARNHRGAAYKHLREYEPALADFNKAIDLDPQDSTGWNNRATIYEDLREFEKALADLDKAVSLNPQSALAWANRGWALVNLRQTDRALTDLNRSIELNPLGGTALASRAGVYADLGQFDRALVDLNEALTLDPENVAARINRGGVYLATREGQKALADANRAIELDATNANAWALRAKVFEKLRQFDNALVDSTTAIDLDARNVHSWVVRGWARVQLNQYDGARADLNWAIELDPNNSDAWKARGVLYYDLKQSDKGLGDLSKAIELAPKDSVALIERARVYVLRREYEKALIDLDKSIELNPNEWECWNDRGAVRSLLGQSEAAASDFRTAIRLAAKDAGKGQSELYLLHHRLGTTLLSLRRPDEAVAPFRESVRLKDDFAPAHNGLGLAIQGNLPKDEAIGEFRKAIQLGKDAPEPHFNLGNAFYEKGQYDEAIAEFREAIQLKQDFGKAYHGLAAVHRQRRAWAQAIPAFTEATRLLPDDANVQIAFAMILANCPDQHYRDPARAIKYATRAAVLAPNDRGCWQVLSVAYYRADDWKRCVEMSQKAMACSNGGNAGEWYFLAMAHYRLGDPTEARTWYDRAVQWHEKNLPTNANLAQYRAEAAKLFESK